MTVRCGRLNQEKRVGLAEPGKEEKRVGLSGRENQAREEKRVGLAEPGKGGKESGVG